MAEAVLRRSSIDLLNDQLLIEHAGLRFTFYQADGCLVVGGLLPSSHDRWDPPLSGLAHCPEQEIKLTGEGQTLPARSRSIGGCGAVLSFQGLEQTPRDNGALFTLHHRRDDIGMLVRSYYEFADSDTPVVRRWVEIENQGSQPIDIEQVESSALYHVAAQSGDPKQSNVRVHIPFSSWAGEGQWRCLKLADLGINAPDSAHYRATCLGSRSSAEKSPCAMIEDRDSGLTWFWQIEHSSSWKWEVGRAHLGAAHGLYLLIGGPDEHYSHWWKRLLPGKVFRSVPIAVGCVSGGFTDAVRALTGYRRTACLKPHPVDDNLPVIFNDYMNGIWGDPTLEKEIPLIEAASKVGCEVFCIDSGYYAAPGESWWDNVGQWAPDSQRFPGQDFNKLMRMIRDKGMIPGLWIESEVCGVSNVMADKPDDWFLSRHGKRLVYNKRFFWNFRHPGVIEHLDAVIDRFVNDYGVGYIKNDYNIDFYCGSDTDADSYGEGMLLHTRALYHWIENIHERHPNLIWENCAAGGLRVDYGILSRAQLQSSSDQEDYACYAPVAIGSSALVLPEQMAVWTYPHENDPEKTIYNMVNVLLFRVHYAGRPDLLDDENLGLVKQGLDYYKRNRQQIKRAMPFYPLGIPGVEDDAQWLALGMQSEHATRLAIWRRNSEASDCRIHLPQIPPTSEVTCVYPAETCYQPNMQFEKGYLHLELPAKCSARLLEFRYSK